jgi:hypothetical protein
MKLIQTPSLITGVILGASLITLSAAGSNAAPEDLNVFFPGTAVSSTEVNDNFTYLDDGMTTLEGRVDNLEGSSSSSEMIYFQSPSLSLDPRAGTNITITVPDGYAYRVVSGWAYNADESDIVSFGSQPCYFNVTVDNLIPSGASHSFYGQVYRIMERRPNDGEYVQSAVFFPPGASLTFSSGTSDTVLNANVCIEKIPFVPVTQNQ